METEEVIRGLLELIYAWQNGVLKKIGISWVEQPPAVLRAEKWLSAQHRVQRTCPSCRGNGLVNNGNQVFYTCRACNGTGQAANA
ncbi:MAG: hypothetical protein HY864_00920 [Chloroflexi bacterium]|nr:hypothetical protein [Chloroflexota bacterium]